MMERTSKLVMINVIKGLVTQGNQKLTLIPEMGTEICILAKIPGMLLLRVYRS